ncbi:hypothetical protein [Gordonia rubripertincta]|uniref:hypothetical protein n=1 Tax=Gordonia rubripertincta TaxID=36822 RepID=UPI0015FCA339|nr:hypothetical protein [Gordonia rubripertincta]QMU19804.1 hypothetical protein H3V45_17290 [Gordonia rubripertincta]
MARTDSFSQFDHLFGDDPTDPWAHNRGESPVYTPDYRLLEQLLGIPVAEGAASESGKFANGIDAWIAHEFRRAGFERDEVWPRASRPRVLPRDISVLLEKLPVQLRHEVAARLPSISAVAPVDARVLGQAYPKQVDVVIARWDRGPELLVSTKAQLSSFGKNLPNRFEESYGDASNLRGRYPLAAVGYFFVQRATIIRDEPDAFERTIDMVRKLRHRGDVNGYTATALLLVDWDESSAEPAVTTHPELVPDDISPPNFFTEMIDHLLSVTPISYHVPVRERRERRELPLPDDLDTV